MLELSYILCYTNYINVSSKKLLYILIRDVIDRGEDGINLLLEITEMPNAVILLGNHEYIIEVNIYAG